MFMFKFSNYLIKNKLLTNQKLERKQSQVITNMKKQFCKNTETIFDKIIRKEIPCNIVFEDEQVK